MKRYSITTGTITYAIKGRDILRNLGYKAKVERKTSGSGCGYMIILEGNIESAEKVLKNAGVKIIQINQI